MDLPDELLLLIFTLGILDVSTRWAVANVCQKWRRIIMDRSLWKGQSIGNIQGQWYMGTSSEDYLDTFGKTDTVSTFLHVDLTLTPAEHDLFKWLLSMADSVELGRSAMGMHDQEHPFPFEMLSLSSNSLTKMVLHLPNDHLPAPLNPELCQRLTSLVLMVPQPYINAWFRRWRSVIVSLPRLDSLCLTGCLAAASWQPETWPMNAFACLRRLDLHYIDDLALEAIAQRARENLVELTVANPSALVSSQYLVDHCPKLTHLALGRPQLSFVMALAAQLTYLEIENMFCATDITPLVPKLSTCMTHCVIRQRLIAPHGSPWTWTHLLQGHTLRVLDLTFQATHSGEEAFDAYVAQFRDTHNTNDCEFSEYNGYFTAKLMIL